MNLIFKHKEIATSNSTYVLKLTKKLLKKLGSKCVSQCRFTRVTSSVVTSRRPETAANRCAPSRAKCITVQLTWL